MNEEMDDVEWLREWCGSALNKCADEIERLREEIERLKSEESCNDVLLEYAQAENERLREENARLRRLFKTAYAEGCYDCTKTVKKTEEFEALWEGSFAYKVILEGAKDG